MIINFKDYNIWKLLNNRLSHFTIFLRKYFRVFNNDIKTIV